MKRFPVLIGIGALSLLLAGCAPGGTAPQAAASHPVVTDPAKIAKTTISVLDMWPGKTTPDSRFWLDVEAGFQSKYPNIKIKRVTGSFDDVNKTIRLKLSDPGAAPDVAFVNNGWQGLGTMAKAHLILDLAPYAKAYGWDHSLPATVQREQNVSKDGKQIGVGDLYGIPVNQAGIIEVNYNKAKLAKLGVGVPKTLGEFEADLAKAKAAGELPIEMGDLDQLGALVALYALQDVQVPAGDLNDFIYGTGSKTMQQLGMPQAASTLQQWSRKGYLEPHVAGLGSGDAMQKFVDGTGVFAFYYSDALPFKNPAQESKFGAFLLPSSTGPAQSGTDATQASFSIASVSKHADAAALFLNYAMGPEAGADAIKEGIMPFLGSYKLPSSTPSYLADEVAISNQLQKSNGFVPYLDWASPTLLTTLGGNAQKLLANKMTPSAFSQAAQADYESFKSKK